ncbi:hypothetical protein LC609_34730 [Nostoc sp. XA013]|nr:hypothetical protein [Nostoc sp. XA013]
MSQSQNSIEIKTLEESQIANLKFNILLETREYCGAIASILKLPQYRLGANT